MTTEEIIDKVNSSEYDFIRTNQHLNTNVILVGVGGSHAYGTSTPESDLDIRGVATRSANDILTGKDFEQITNNVTDTTIYSFDKIVKLLCSCNPNTIEMLGLKPEHYLHLSPTGKLLLDNADLFLSKKALNSFGGYAMAQLNRLYNKSGRALEVIENNEARSINKALIAVCSQQGIDRNKVQVFADDNIHVNINGDFTLEQFVKIYQAVDSVHTDYCKSTRNNKAIEHGKLAKHQMHLTRLYLMAIDILQDGKIITYREKEHDFLMDIRNGKYLKDETTPTDEFMSIVSDLEGEMKSAAEKSELPDSPDMDKVNELVARVNKNVIFANYGIY